MFTLSKNHRHNVPICSCFVSLNYTRYAKDVSCLRRLRDQPHMPCVQPLDPRKFHPSSVRHIANIKRSIVKRRPIRNRGQAVVNDFSRSDSYFLLCGRRRPCYGDGPLYLPMLFKVPTVLIASPTRCQARHRLVFPSVAQLCVSERTVACCFCYCSPLRYRIVWVTSRGSILHRRRVVCLCPYARCSRLSVNVNPPAPGSEIAENCFAARSTIS